MTIGFVALWTNSQREYCAAAADERGTTDRIQAAFAHGRSRGITTYGLYNCRWSSAWSYFTFWVSPSLRAVEDTIADLEQAGDFKFADSHHIVGRFVEDSNYLTPGAWDKIPELVDGEPSPLGLFLAAPGPLGHTASRLQKQTDLDLPALTAALGIRMYGRFDCQFSTGWDRFMFWTAPHLMAIDGVLSEMERRCALGAGTRAVTGRLERYYRFGNHLQTDLPWLNEEGRTS